MVPWISSFHVLLIPPPRIPSLPYLSILPLCLDSPSWHVMLYPEISIFPYTFHMEYADVYDPQKRGLRQFLLRNAENLVPTCTHFAFTNLLKKRKYSLHHQKMCLGPFRTHGFSLCDATSHLYITDFHLLVIHPPLQ